MPPIGVPAGAMKKIALVFSTLDYAGIDAYYPLGSDYYNDDVATLEIIGHRLTPSTSLPS